MACGLCWEFALSLGEDLKQAVLQFVEIEDAPRALPLTMNPETMEFRYT